MVKYEVWFEYAPDQWNHWDSFRSLEEALEGAEEYVEDYISAKIVKETRERVWSKNRKS